MSHTLVKLVALEAKARMNKHRPFGDYINGRLVTVTAHSSMINRGMATGDCTRLTYKLNGKRASAAAVLEAIYADPA